MSANEVDRAGRLLRFRPDHMTTLAACSGGALPFCGGKRAPGAGCCFRSGISTSAAAA